MNYGFLSVTKKGVDDQGRKGLAYISRRKICKAGALLNFESKTTTILSGCGYFEKIASYQTSSSLLTSGTVSRPVTLPDNSQRLSIEFYLRGICLADYLDHHCGAFEGSTQRNSAPEPQDGWDPVTGLPTGFLVFRYVGRGGKVIEATNAMFRHVVIRCNRTEGDTPVAMTWVEPQSEREWNDPRAMSEKCLVTKGLSEVRPQPSLTAFEVLEFLEDVTTRLPNLDEHFRAYLTALPKNLRKRRKSKGIPIGVTKEDKGLGSRDSTEAEVVTEAEDIIEGVTGTESGKETEAPARVEVAEQLLEEVQSRDRVSEIQRPPPDTSDSAISTSYQSNLLLANGFSDCNIGKSSADYYVEAYNVEVIREPGELGLTSSILAIGPYL
ncbi:uncharacterized protein RSE6_13649 [Rhynchosporium secalis]|uniref:Uncharacterized protein n=1 Tax=Rhynchosporium secalis TaxID=38038 RepID=A0A1E1MTC0_RHYSE|nr:uncharacterized protein RSE6_13649 [Rhynchosporium secalis]